ncbi:MAG: histidine phosphatase family protein [Candidatus Pacearchaeota archaeon]
MNKKEVFNIYLFRHGQTYYNEKKIFTGWKDSKLTINGKKSADILAKKLKNRRIDFAFQTSLSRSRETLKTVLKYHPECRGIITDDRMIERSYGSLEGMSHSNFKKKIGKKLYDLEVSSYISYPLSSKEKEKIKELLGEEEFKLVHRSYEIAPPNGESLKDVEKRVKDFIMFLVKFIKKNKVNVAISAHGNSIRMFRKIWERKSEEECLKWAIPHTKIYNYKVEI